MILRYDNGSICAKKITLNERYIAVDAWGWVMSLNVVDNEGKRSSEGNSMNFAWCICVGNSGVKLKFKDM